MEVVVDGKTGLVTPDDGTSVATSPPAAG